MTLNKGDFIEINFTGRITDSKEIFDTNTESDAKEAGFNLKEIKPLVLSIGNKMVPPGLDEDFVGKEVGKTYTVEISPEKAFGKRNSKMVNMIPTKLFHEQKIIPERGMQLNLDGQLVKILSSSAGRTLVDFNNPLAGKNITYTYTINKKIDDKDDKVNALQDFLFRRRFDFTINDDKVTFKVEELYEPTIKIFAPKFEEITGLKIETEVVKKEEKKEDKGSIQKL